MWGFNLGLQSSLGAVYLAEQGWSYFGVYSATIQMKATEQHSPGGGAYYAVQAGLNF